MADKDGKDLDFDELHKAVNELMVKAQRGRSKRAKSAVADEDKSEKQPEPAKVDESPVAVEPSKLADKPKEDNDRVIVSVKRPLPQLTNHKASHGRAMDVVGPPARSQAPAPSANVKRNTGTLQPTGRSLDEEPAPAIVPDPKPLEEPKESDELKAALASLGGADELTKPEADLPTLTHEDTKLEEPKSEAEPEDATQDQESSSPFITTKVEKRPLGAYASAAATDEPADDADNPEAPAKAEQDQASPETQDDAPNPLPIQPQPEEFSPAVVAVESAEKEFNQTAEPDDQDYRAMAIPQQYKEADAAQNDAPRPVFDTTQYHPAIEAHTTGRSGAAGKWVIALLLVVMLVVGLGAVYYFLTGSLDFTALLSY